MSAALLASSLALCAPAWSQSSQGGGASTSFEAELSRLAEISTRLSSLNERLRTELEASKRSSEELEDSLVRSSSELEGLRREFEDSRRISNELASRAERSEMESTELRAALTRAEDSLRSLERSFEAYRLEAEARIRRLVTWRWIWAAAAAAGWALALIVFLAG